MGESLACFSSFFKAVFLKLPTFSVAAAQLQQNYLQKKFCSQKYSKANLSVDPTKSGWIPNISQSFDSCPTCHAPRWWNLQTNLVQQLYKKSNVWINPKCHLLWVDPECGLIPEILHKVLIPVLHVMLPIDEILKPILLRIVYKNQTSRSHQSVIYNAWIQNVGESLNVCKVILLMFHNDETFQLTYFHG